MWDFLKAEFIRFRAWAFAAAALHLVALGFMSRMVDLAQQPLLVHWVIGGVYALAGALLGLYQMGSYRRPSQWLNLLHRPLPPSRIVAGLALAALALLAIAVALPILVVAGWQESGTARVVDLRHWALPLAAWLVAGCAYLAGAFASLRGARLAGAAIVLVFWLLASDAVGPGFLAVALIALAWLAWLLRGAFQPDLAAMPAGTAGLPVLLLPAAMAAYLALLLLFVAGELVWIAQGSHPNNTATPPPGGHNLVEKADARGRMLAALEGSTHADAPLLREQIRLSEPMGLGVQVPKQPQRQELSNFRPMEFEDEGQGLRWVYSHDDGRLHGYRLADGAAAGVLGVGPDHAAFDAPVLAGGPLPGMGEHDAVLVGGSALWHYDSEARAVRERLRLPDGETLMGGSPLSDAIGMLGDQALYFYDARAFAEAAGEIAPRLRVPLPGRIGDLQALEMIELVDGYLVVFTFSAKAHSLAGGEPFQAALRVDGEGGIETIHRRTLAHDFPVLYRTRAWWPSPLLHAVREQARGLFAPPMPLEATSPLPVPRLAWIVAIVLMLVAAGLAAWRGARAGLAPRARLGWILACAALGLPGVLAMHLLLPPRE